MHERIDDELDPANPDVDVVITSDRDSSGFLLWEQASVAGTADYRNDYQFDGYGRPVAVTQDSVDGGNAVEKKRVEFSYDLKSRLAAIDRYLYETDGTTLDPVASSSYSCTDGDLTGLVHSDPAEAILREYDWTYQAGRIVGETVDDDTRAFTYDADGQLKTVTAVPPGGSTPVETEFVYDATGNREEIKEDNVQVADYEVDAFNRVTFDGVYHYEYDPEGNRTAKFVDGTPANGTLDSGDTDWTEYTWDHRNRLIRVESGAAYGTTDVTVTFGYDWLNRWISTDVDYAVGTDTSEYFVYGQATLPDEVTPWDRAGADARDIGQIVLRFDETEKITNRYLWGPAVDQILADEQISWTGQAYSTDRVLWPLADHQGTVRDLAKVNGSGVTEIVNTRTYDAYGNLLAETAPAVDHLFGFTGRPTEGETGLQNNLNRWYDPVIASWTTQDPITFQGGDANLYRYCGNDPVNSVDPSGLESLISEVPVQCGPIQCKLLFYKGVCIGWEDPTGAVWRLHSPGKAYIGGSAGDPRSWYRAWEKKCYVASRAEVDAAIEALWWGNVDWDAWFADKGVRETFKLGNSVREAIFAKALAHSEDFYAKKYQVEQQTNTIIKYDMPLMYGGQLLTAAQAAQIRNIRLGGPSRYAPAPSAARAASTDEFVIYGNYSQSKALYAMIDQEGVVTFAIEAGAGSKPRGAVMFCRMMQHFGSNVKAICGSWTYGDNLAAFNTLTAQGMAPETAAAASWTGCQAAKFGFTAVRIITLEGSPGAYTRVLVLFLP